MAVLWTNQRQWSADAWACQDKHPHFASELTGAWSLLGAPQSQTFGGETPLTALPGKADRSRQAPASVQGDLTQHC